MAKEKEKGEDHEVLKEAYDKAKAKFNLIPTFEELDKDFEISVIDPDRIHFIIRDVKRAISSKLHKFIDNLAPILSPQPSSLHSLIEVKLFEKEEVNDMFKFYKKLMQLLHKSILTTLKTEKDEADFVNEIWQDWPKLKSKMRTYMERITDGWLKEDEEEIRDEYLG